MVQKELSKQIEDILKLTPTQEGILFHCLKNPHHSFYVCQIALDLEGELSIPHLERALNAVVEENQCLRSIFKWEKLSHPVQIILRQMSYSITKHNLLNDPEEVREEKINQIQTAEREKGFDLTEGPLLRISMCLVGEKQYRMLIHFHHIVMDGWSLGIFLSEWFNQYDLIAKDRKGEQKILKTKYKEYIKWLEQQDGKKAKEFWAAQFDQWERTTKLPYTAYRDEKMIKMDSVSFSLGEVMPKVKHFAQLHNVTLNSILNAAWGMVLQRYSGSDDITFGLTVSGRPEDIREVDQIVGLFINTIPIRIKIASEQTVVELMKEVHGYLISSKDYHYTPLTEIHSAANLRGTESLFDHILVFENYPLDQTLAERENRDFKITNYTEWEANHYDLTVSFLLAGEPQLKLDYKSGIFERQAMERMVQHFLTVLTQMMSQPEEKVKNLSILPDWEKRKILSEFNQTFQGFSMNQTVYELFLEQVKKAPSLEAVIFQEESITYKQLYERSNRLAGVLRDRGVEEGNIIPIVLDWSIDMVVAIMGVLGSGGAYLAIDPQYPTDRIHYMIQDSQAKVLITSRNCQSALSHMLSEQILIDDEESLLPFSDEIQAQSSPDDLAYVIYTSGSTGQPKGVMIEQQSFVEFVQWAVEEYEHREGYQVLLSNSFAFDSSILQIFPALVSGGTLHLLHPDVRKDARKYLEYLKANKINNIDEIPVVMNILLEQIYETDELPFLPHLTCLSLGSEYVPIELVKKCRTYLNNTGRIINGYGPAEASVVASTYHFDGNSEGELSLIGKPRSNLHMYIVDSQGNLCPIGIPGEICIGGIGLARGYLNKPDLTNGKFVHYALDGMTERLYKTGDAGRWLEDGNIDFLGRIDYQVKIRGYRVEVEEIENVLRKYPKIVDVVVVARKDPARGELLCAFVTSQLQLDKQDVKRWLAGQLPDYMLPAMYYELDEFPLTPNGKINRKYLAQMELVWNEEPADGSVARHDLDQQIADIWKETLGIEQVGMQTSFFEAGGNSILIMRMFNKLKKEFPDLSIEISDLFTYNTIAHLADFILESSATITNEQNQKSEFIEEQDVSREHHSVKDIAIIGISAKLPGADQLEDFWQLLLQGQASIKEISTSRKELDPAKSSSKKYLRYGYIEGIDQFDPHYFNISPKIAKIMDPNQRLMLQTVHSTIEDAGYSRDKLMNQHIGVFMASVLPSYYKYLDVKVDELLASNLPANLAGQISYRFGFNGPSMVIDTACSSSLVALHSAIQSLRNGECEAALVGGIHIEIDHVQKESAMESGIVSPTETCRAFSDDADGTIGGEGTICIMIKPLEKAVEHNDHIYAVVKGSAVVQDGARSNGITAPSADAQADTIKRAWQDAQIAPTTISYIEAHGTGTKLGDPIEIKGIQKAFQSFTDQKQWIALGSVKTNIGHLDSAAGLAGLVKTALSLKHKIIPPSLHYTKANSFIDFERSPVYVNTSVQHWEEKQGHPRRAGVSSFGLSGTNVHVVVEEFRDARIQSKIESNQPYHLITVSAPNQNVLKKKIRDLIDYITRNQSSSLQDISYTLNCRRTHERYRFSVVVKDKEELGHALEEAEKKEYQITSAQKNDAAILADSLQRLSTAYDREALTQLSKLYQEGYNLPFESIQKGRTIPLPAYPFENKSYWFEKAVQETNSSALFTKKTNALDQINEELFHHFIWKETKVSIDGAMRTSGSILVVMNQEENFPPLLSLLSNEGQHVIQVYYGQYYQKWAVDRYEINPNEASQFSRLTDELEEDGITIETVIDLSTLQHSQMLNSPVEVLNQWKEQTLQCYFPTLHLVKSLSTLVTEHQHPIHTYFISTQAFNVLENDPIVNPLQSFTLALHRSIHRELEHVRSYCIDMDWQNGPLEEMAQLIVREIKGNHSIREVAYRDGRRYVKTLQPLSLDSLPKRAAFRENGVYLVTGGTGGISLEICQSIARQHKVSLLLLGRTSWQELSTDQLKAIEECQQLGTEVLYYQADVSDVEELRQAVDKITAQFGKIDGVIHTAGIIGKPTALLDTEFEDYERVCQAKIQGILNIDQLLRGHYLDFVVLFSSVDAMISEKMIAPYTFANAFLDSYASLQRQLGKKYISINWGGWQNTGMGDVKRVGSAQSQIEQIKRLSPLVIGFDRNEGVSAFHALVNANVSHAFISGLNQEDIQELKELSLFDINSQLLAASAQTSSSLDLEAMTLEQIVTIVSETWREILELEEEEELDPTESYFALGGDSIQGIDITMKLSNLFSLTLDANTIFKYDQVQTLSQYIYDSLKGPEPKTQRKKMIPKAKPIG